MTKKELKTGMHLYPHLNNEKLLEKRDIEFKAFVLKNDDSPSNVKIRGNMITIKKIGFNRIQYTLTGNTESIEFLDKLINGEMQVSYSCSIG